MLGHIKAAIVTDEGNGVTLNLTDLDNGVEHHGTLEPQEKVHFDFMCAVLDVDEHELKHQMYHAIDDTGLDYELDEHVECHCHDHDHHHDHDHDHEHAHDHDHEHGHGHDREEFHVCEHKHEGALTLYFLSPLLHALQVAAAILVVNFAFGTLFFLVGEERVVGFLEGAGYWFQPLVAVLVGLVPNCASSVVLAETYAVGGLTLASCLAGLVTNTGLGILVLFQNAKAWKRNLAVLGALTALGIAVGYAGNALMLLF